MLRRIAILILTFSASITAEEAQTTVIDQAITRLRERPEGIPEEQRKKEIQSMLKDLSDEMLMRSAIEWTFLQIDDPYIGGHVRWLLEYVERAKSSATLREYMAEVDDAKKAYKLISISTLFRDEDFIAEISHLLRNTDDAFTHIQERPPERICDNVYRGIAMDLKKANADFKPVKIPREGGIDLEARLKMIQWLTKNWPGCEYLATGDRPSSKEPRRHLDTSAPNLAQNDGSGSASRETIWSDTRWLVSALVVLVLIGGLLYLRVKSKR